MKPTEGRRLPAGRSSTLLAAGDLITRGYFPPFVAPNLAEKLRYYRFTTNAGIVHQARDACPQSRCMRIQIVAAIPAYQSLRPVSAAQL
jgi:hypothetical protein